LPFIHEAVKHWSGDRDICSLAGPEIAYGGAALFAENLGGTRNATLDFHIQDVDSHSYAIRSTDTAPDAAPAQVVITRGSPLPTTKRAAVAKHTARQSEINFQIVELDDSNPDAATVIGHCSIGNLPPGLPVGTPIEVELTLDPRGILSVFAISLATGRRFIPAYQTTLGMSVEQRTHWRSWLQTLGGSGA
jgi:molecular chaperone DnaK (HSP70)